MPEYDPNVTTHIITDAPAGTTLRALGVKRLKDIPDHIPTLKWSWVVAGINYKTSLSKEEFDAKLDGDILFLHAAFHERMDAGRKLRPITVPSFRRKGKERALDQNRGEGPSTTGFGV
jgi:DNA polymerase lambda